MTVQAQTGAATAATGADRAAGQDAQNGYPRRWAMLPVILIAMFMAGFDIWAVNVAAPSLQRDLHVSDAALQLIVGGYAFMYASGMVTGGRLGDLFGYKRLFLIGVVTFALASLACGVAPTAGMLVAFRLVQGLTGAVMVPQVVALITATFPARERSKALGFYGATMGLGFVSGQILGGGLIQANIFGLGWRAIFLVNVPVGVIALIVAAVVVPRATGLRKPRLDPLGAIGVSGGLALALVPLTLGRDEGWPVWTWISLALALPALAATVAWERRLHPGRRRPAAEPGALPRPRVLGGLLLNFACLFFFGSFMFVLTLLLQSGLGLSPLHAGIVNLPLALTFIAMTLLGPKVAARLGPRSITLGAVAAIAGAPRARPHRRALRRPADRLGDRAGDRPDRDRAGADGAVADERRALARPPRAGGGGGRGAHHHPAVLDRQRRRGHRRRLLRGDRRRADQGQLRHRADGGRLGRRGAARRRGGADVPAAQGQGQGGSGRGPSRGGVGAVEWARWSGRGRVSQAMNSAIAVNWQVAAAQT